MSQTFEEGFSEEFSKAFWVAKKCTSKNTLRGMRNLICGQKFLVGPQVFKRTNSDCSRILVKKTFLLSLLRRIQRRCERCEFFVSRLVLRGSNFVASARRTKFWIDFRPCFWACKNPKWKLVPRGVTTFTMTLDPTLVVKYSLSKRKKLVLCVRNYNSWNRMDFFVVFP